jgi:molybdate transport system ATP-binding protein
MLLSLNDISLQINGGAAFEHTTWEIREDEHWAILGPTGAGKSLLAGVVDRRIPVSRGSVCYYFDGPTAPSGRTYLLAGEVLTLSAETHRAFLRHYAGYHQARWQSMEGEETPGTSDLLERIPEVTSTDRAEVIRLLGLEPLLERKVLHLSHGESRKLHLACLLLRRPRLLILDDPFVGLDRQARPQLARIVQDLLRAGRPQILFISSRRDEIPVGVHRLLLVENLSARAQGEAGEILSRDAPQEPAALQLTGLTLAAMERVTAQFAVALRDDSVCPELVRLRNVSVAYGPVRVLSGVDWCVGRGERWSLSGHNGAGKTTLLSLILADNPQGYANEIYLFGQRRGSGESIWDIKKNIGWVSPELHIHYPRNATCFEAVGSGLFDSVGLFRHLTPEQCARVEDWLEAFELHGLADTPFQALSAGQQRLALVARALVKEPPLLVLDEPCQGLDAAHRHLLIDLLDQICRKTALTMIYVTHYADELPASITHYIRLEHGRVMQAGPLPEA